MIRYGKENEATPMQIALAATAGASAGNASSVVYEGLMQLHASLSMLEAYLTSSSSEEQLPLNDHIVGSFVIGLEERARALAALASTTMRIEWLPGCEVEGP
jgi:hypothetical protein